jgi:hypothetical protein
MIQASPYGSSRMNRGRVPGGVGWECNVAPTGPGPGPARCVTESDGHYGPIWAALQPSDVRGDQ